MLDFIAHPSKIDGSINYICDLGSEGMIECRYVKRSEKKHHNIYLSAQTYCNQGCLFCHLTATKQTTGREITTVEIADQAEAVMRGIYSEKPFNGEFNTFRSEDEIHFLFMARGDVLASTIPQRWREVCEAIDERVVKCGFDPEKVIFKISTIYPESYIQKIQNLPLHFMKGIKQRHWPIFYYSMYSIYNNWLNRWMPNADYPTLALADLKEWQNSTGMKIGIHYAPLASTVQKDSRKRIVDAVVDSGLEPFWNLVYFNPPTSFTNSIYNKNQDRLLEETKLIILSKMPNAQVKIQPRVGADVAASCGMFGAMKDGKLHLPVVK